MMHVESRRAALMLTLSMAVALIAFACSGGEDATPTAEPTNTSPDPVASTPGPGTFIFEGARVEPPYDVVASGRDISVNGTQIVRLGGIEGEAPDPTAEVLDAFGLADLAALAYDDAGGGDAGLDAARFEILDHPLLSSATLDVETGELAIVDRDGLEVLFIPEPPDDQNRLVSEADWSALATEQAADWDQLLAGGGLLLIPSAGPSLSVGAAAVRDVLDELDAAIGLTGAAREARLLALLSDERSVAEIIANYVPAPRASRAPPLAPADGRMTSISYAAPAPTTTGSIGQAAGGISQTPGAPNAWVFATLYNADARSFINSLITEGYSVSSYDSTQRPFGGLGLAAFKTTSKTGALYLATHGSPRGVSVEKFPNRAAAARVSVALRASEPSANYYWWRDSSNKWWLAISKAGIRAHWESNNTIVHAAICRAISLSDAFNAREYFSYQPTTSCAVAAPDTTLLWQRMTGVQGAGHFRPASVAFAQGGFSAGFGYVDGSVNEDTVLSPGIVEFRARDLRVGEEAFVVITFDAILNRSVPANSLLRIVGCAPPTADASYTLTGNIGAPAFGITVPVKAKEPGTTSVTVIAAQTKSPGKIHLDGNQLPANSNHVAQNRDDYVGGFNCVDTGIPFTSTPGLPPPTPIVPTPTPEATPTAEATPTPEATPTATGTSGAPPVETPPGSDNATWVADESVTVPRGKILTFYLGGVFYNASELVSVDAHLPFCSYWHVHGAPISPVQPPGGGSISEHLGECGYGPPNFYLIDRR